MAAYLPMSSTRRSVGWSFIIILCGLAFLRTLSPEKTESAVRRLVKKKNQFNKEADQREKKIQDDKDELQRERSALEKWKAELDERETKLEQKEKDSEIITTEENEDDEQSDFKGNLNDELVEDMGDVGEDVASEEVINDLQKESEENSHQSDEEDSNKTDEEDSNKTDEEDSTKTDDNTPLDLADEAIPALSDDECPIIIAPEHIRGGFGTQIEHIWTSISLTLSVRNSCMVIPPVISNDAAGNFRPIPFHEVFDTETLSLTGLRFVPLRTCQKHGVGTVFDDVGKDTAIVKNFALYVAESHPNLAEETTMVHADSKGLRFLEDSVVGEDPNIVAKHVVDSLPEDPGRQCVGFGRMRAKIEINGDVLKFFKPAQEISEFVETMFPRANETLFVNLRWNQAHCEKARTTDGTVCIFGDQTAPVEEYVSSIGHLASRVGAKSIYISAPPHVPDDVSSYIAEHLKTLDPVILDVDGDAFTAGVVERELAVRAMRFVTDGGNWGATVLQSKKAQYPQFYIEELTSLSMIQTWKDEGWRRDSEFLINMVEPESPSTNIESDDTVNESVVSVAVPTEETTERPNEYVPPSHFKPSEDEDQEIREIAEMMAPEQVRSATVKSPDQTENVEARAGISIPDVASGEVAQVAVNPVVATHVEDNNGAPPEQTILSHENVIQAPDSIAGANHSTTVIAENEEARNQIPKVGVPPPQAIGVPAGQQVGVNVMDMSTEYIAPQIRQATEAA